MERPIYKRGFVQPLQNIVEQIGRAEITNILNLEEAIFSQFGVLMKINPGGVYSDDLKPILEDSETGGKRIRVRPGTAITGGGSNTKGHIINVKNDYVVQLETPETNIIKYLKLKYIPEYQDEVPFDKTYSNNGYSYQADSYEWVFDSNPPDEDNYEVGIAKAQYINTSGWTLIDIRQMAVLRSVWQGSIVAPSQPQNIALTWGSMEEMINALGYGGECIVPVSCWVKVTWEPGSGGGEVNYYLVDCVPVDANNEPAEEYMLCGNVNKNITDENVFVFNNLASAIKYRVRVWAVGMPPYYPVSAPAVGYIIPGYSLSVENLKCVDTYVVRPQRNNGDPVSPWDLDVSWNLVSGAIGYNVVVLDSAGKTAFKANVNRPHITIPEVTAGVVYTIKVKAYDETGRYGNETTKTWKAGDTLSPACYGSKFTLTAELYEGNAGIGGPRRDIRGRVRQKWEIKTIEERGWYDPDETWTGGSKHGIGLKKFIAWMCIGDQSGPNEQTVISQAVDYEEVQISPRYMNVIWENLIPGNYYWFRLQAVDKADNISPLGDWVSVWVGRTSPPEPVENLVINQRYNGIEVSWNYLATGDNEPVAFEVFVNWGAESPPDPDYRYLFATLPSEKRSVFIPANLSSFTNMKVAVTVRAVGDDSTYSQVKSVGPVDVQKVANPDDITNLKAEITAAKTVGNSVYSDLKSRLDAGISDFGIEITEARGGFRNLAERLSALSAAGVTWKDVLIVAKEGGHFNSIQAAIDSLTSDRSVLILVMSGIYEENIFVQEDSPSIAIVGWTPYDVVIQGSIQTEPAHNLYMISGLCIRTPVGSKYALKIMNRGVGSGGRPFAPAMFVIKDCHIEPVSGYIHLENTGDVRIVNSVIRAALNPCLIYVYRSSNSEACHCLCYNSIVYNFGANAFLVRSDHDVNVRKVAAKLKVFNSNIVTDPATPCITASAEGIPGGQWLILAHSRYVTSPDTTNFGQVSFGTVDNLTNAKFVYPSDLYNEELF